MQKILIADDDMRMRRVIGEMVNGLGMTIHEARDGAEAVDLFVLELPDWVLMDLRMKPVDGLSATARIKAHSPNARVVIVSQYDDAALREAAGRAGACGYVLKENLHELSGILNGKASGTLDER